MPNDILIEGGGANQTIRCHFLVYFCSLQKCQFQISERFELEFSEQKACLLTPRPRPRPIRYLSITKHNICGIRRQTEQNKSPLSHKSFMMTTKPISRSHTALKFFKKTFKTSYFDHNKLARVGLEVKIPQVRQNNYPKICLSQLCHL